MKPMDRIERQNAASMIEGYCALYPGEKADDGIERARQKCLTLLRRQIECVESITNSEILSGLPFPDTDVESDSFRKAHAREVGEAGKANQN